MRSHICRIIISLVGGLDGSTKSNKLKGITHKQHMTCNNCTSVSSLLLLFVLLMACASVLPFKHSGCHHNKTQGCFIIVTLTWTQSLLSFVVLLLYEVSYVPKVEQQRVLAVLQEVPSLSPPGLDLHLGFVFGLGRGPWVPLCLLKTLVVSDSPGPGWQKMRLSVSGVETGWDPFVELGEWVVGNLWS